MGNIQADSSVIVRSPLGGLAFQVVSGALSEIRYIDGPLREAPARSEFEHAVAAQLGRYFADPGPGFDLPLSLQGSAFQQRVWQRLQQIPLGTVCTYGALAGEFGTSPRAIGNACRANPVPIVVPCHRVVAVHGWGGYAGAKGGKKLAAKRWLLRHEGVPERA